MPCAMPIVKGFSVAPAKPTCAARYEMQTPVIESYPIDTAIGTKMTIKAIVSSLMPNTEPKTLNINIMTTSTKESTSTLASHFFCRHRRVKATNSLTPVSIALVLFNIQKAPPTISTNTMMPAFSTKP